MDTTIQTKKAALHATIYTATSPSLCVMFLSGGGLTVGRERYMAWQEALVQQGISSISFDYSGIRGSGTSLEESSLEERIQEAVAIADWMKVHLPAKKYVLYGVSMGGYIALGLVRQQTSLFNALILHAPAAYARAAHSVHFGDTFTKEIKREHSWDDSYSFEWLGGYDHPVLLIEAMCDDIIPHTIVEKYKQMKKEGLSVLQLGDTPHEIWGKSPVEVKARDEIYQALTNFLANI